MSSLPPSMEDGGKASELFGTVEVNQVAGVETRVAKETMVELGEMLA